MHILNSMDFIQGEPCIESFICGSISITGLFPPSLPHVHSILQPRFVCHTLSMGSHRQVIWTFFPFLCHYVNFEKFPQPFIVVGWTSAFQV